MSNVPRFLLRADASSPNPGPSGIGYALWHADDIPVGGITSILPPGSAPRVMVGAGIGESLVNAAEYTGLIVALRHAIRLGMWTLDIEMDSQLVVNQVKGLWRVRDSWLKRLHAEVKALLAVLSEYTIKHIPREENSLADRLSREPMWGTDVAPTLPPPVITDGRARNRLLLPWQAAFIRHHWRAGVRNAYFWGRIFGVDSGLIDAIGAGRTYEDAAFTDMPSWAHMEVTTPTRRPAEIEQGAGI